MKRFRFSLEKVLTVRGIKKRLSEEAFASAKARRAEALALLAEANETHALSREEMSKSLCETIDPWRVKERSLYREWARAQVELTERELEQAEEVLSSRRRDLIEKTRQEKSLLNLRQRKKDEFWEAYFWEQGKILDEVGISRFIRRKGKEVTTNDHE